MAITIICVASGLAMVICFIVENIRYKKRTDDMDELRSLMRNIRKSDFSVSEYYERMEKASVEIAQKREKEPAYIITLWAGLDGLRMNEDGTTEWIRREEYKPKPISGSYSPPQGIAQSVVSPYVGCQNMTSEIDSQIRMLQDRIDACRMEIQYSQIINAVQPLPYPQYPYIGFYSSPYFNQQYYN